MSTYYYKSKGKALQKTLYLLILIISPFAVLIGQEEEEIDSSYIDAIAALVYLDSITITPDDDTLDVEKFIEIVLNDESFYHAFSNLRITQHIINDSIRYFNKKKKEIASYKGTHLQTVAGMCREMETLEYSATGKYFDKKNRYKFYTSSFIDRVFYTKGKKCHETQKTSMHAINPSSFEYQINQLKTIIFSPGKEVDIPIVGKKLAIFSKKMRKYYDYTIRKSSIDSFQNTYVFDVQVKPEFVNKENKTIIRYMTTYFDAIDFQVLKREYAMDMKSILYELDISVSVELTKNNNSYIPAKVRYDGFWKIPTKKPEICTFTFDFSEFK